MLECVVFAVRLVVTVEERLRDRLAISRGANTAPCAKPRNGEIHGHLRPNDPSSAVNPRSGTVGWSALLGHMQSGVQPHMGSELVVRQPLFDFTKVV